MTERRVTVVYTDGACSGNPGPGGWAWAEPGGAWACGPAAHTTNQRMEITAAYEAALDASAPYVAVLPYPEPDRPWSDDNRRRFAELVAAARSVVTLEKKRPDSRADFRNSLARRDGWLAANVDEAVLVWDGEDRSLAELNRKLVKRLGEEEVWVIAP